MDWKETLSRLSIQQESTFGDSLSSGLSQNDSTAAPPNRPEGKTKSKGRLQIVTEKKGRGGKTATIIFGFDASVPDEEISALGTRLKKRLATGGSARGREILIQGERREEVGRLLAEEGYRIGKG